MTRIPVDWPPPAELRAPAQTHPPGDCKRNRPTTHVAPDDAATPPRPSPARPTTPARAVAQDLQLTAHRRAQTPPRSSAATSPRVRRAHDGRPPATARAGAHYRARDT